LHINTDNYAAGKTQAVQEYLEGNRRRFVAHCIPTHSSWLDHLERRFAEIANKRVQRESCPSVNALIRAIKEYIKQWNKSGRKFQRVKSAEHISHRILLASIHVMQFDFVRTLASNDIGNYDRSRSIFLVPSTTNPSVGTAR
jgi:uncharacterized C2H2 Zn-finger protein